MSIFDRFLEGIDLSGFHSLICIFGALLAVYVMQLTHHEEEDAADPWIIRNSSRIALTMIAIALLWSVYYSLGRNWQPWPPQILLVMGIDFALALRVSAIWARIGRDRLRGRARLEKAKSRN
jgi:hypothetical protein